MTDCQFSFLLAPYFVSKHVSKSQNWLSKQQAVASPRTHQELLTTSKLSEYSFSSVESFSAFSQRHCMYTKSESSIKANAMQVHHNCLHWYGMHLEKSVEIIRGLLRQKRNTIEWMLGLSRWIGFLAKHSKLLRTVTLSLCDKPCTQDWLSQPAHMLGANTFKGLTDSTSVHIQTMCSKGNNCCLVAVILYYSIMMAGWLVKDFSAARKKGNTTVPQSDSFAKGHCSS